MKINNWLKMQTLPANIESFDISFCKKKKIRLILVNI
jgi:hypothetical protein